MGGKEGGFYGFKNVLKVLLIASSSFAHRLRRFANPPRLCVFASTEAVLGFQPYLQNRQLKLTDPYYYCSQQQLQYK